MPLCLRVVIAAAPECRVDIRVARVVRVAAQARTAATIPSAGDPRAAATEKPNGPGRRCRAVRVITIRPSIALLFSLFVFLDDLLWVLVERVPTTGAAEIVGLAVVAHRDGAESAGDNALLFLRSARQRFTFLVARHFVELGEYRAAFRPALIGVNEAQPLGCGIDR